MLRIPTEMVKESNVKHFIRGSVAVADVNRRPTKNNDGNSKKNLGASKR